MDETWTLILLSLAMLIGCYLAGSIPLAFTMSENKLKLVTVLGAGLLVGTALAVIIPEGVHALIETSHHDHHVLTKREINLNVPNFSDKIDHSSKEPGAKILVDKTIQEVNKVNEHSHDHEHTYDETDSNSKKGVEAHSLIGVSLVLGFVFMLLVDQIGGGHSFLENGSQNRNKITATLGLVVHAAADGVALGAAASTSQMHVEMIVFTAIMLHKAPAAFGLVSFLMHEGFDRKRIRKHLLIFTLSAPCLAILTFFGLGQTNKEALSDSHATGIAMLFSGGTFLYVATVHILPELARFGPGTITPLQVQGVLPDTIVSGGHSHKNGTGFSRIELIVIVTGCLLPLILAIGHHH